MILYFPHRYEYGKEIGSFSLPTSQNGQDKRTIVMKLAAYLSLYIFTVRKGIENRTAR